MLTYVSSLLSDDDYLQVISFSCVAVYDEQFFFLQSAKRPRYELSVTVLRRTCSLKVAVFSARLRKK